MFRRTLSTGCVLVTLLGAGLFSARAARGNGAFPDTSQVLLPADRPDTIVVGTNFGLVISDNGGASWRWTCEHDEGAGGYRYQLSGATPPRLLALGNDGLAFSDDLACTWATPTPPDLFVRDFFPDPGAPNHILALADRVIDGKQISLILESTDGARTLGKTVFTADPGLVIGTLEMARSNPRILYVTLAMLSGTGPPRLARSVDGGGTWEVVQPTPVLDKHNIWIAAVDPLDPRTLYLRATSQDDNDKLAVSRDGGTTLEVPLTVRGPMWGFARMDDGTILVGSNYKTEGSLFRSVDGGHSFTTLPPSIHPRSLTARGTKVYAATDDLLDKSALAVSSDRGDSWQRMMSFADIGSISTCGSLPAACVSQCANLQAMGVIKPRVCDPSLEAGADNGRRDAGESAGGAGGEGRGCECHLDAGRGRGGSGAGVLVAVIAGVAGIAGGRGRRRRRRKHRKKDGTRVTSARHGAAGTAAQSAHRINFSWLVRLRWGAVVGQLATIWVVENLLAIDLPLAPLLAVVAMEAATNLAAALWLRAGRPVGESAMALTMALDTALLTALLFFSGGPFNPFSFLYLVHIALAAVILRTAWTWALVALSLVCSGGLFYGPLWMRLAPVGATSHADHMQMHLQGMWIAFGVAAAFIVYFVTRIRRALAEREADLAAQRAAALRNERLASLATLAAGAAHELATPLGTIAVTARELEREAEHLRPARMEDVRLIRAEIERCRNILNQMAAKAGESAGETPVRTSLGQVVDEALRGLPASPAVRADPGPWREATLVAPPRALGQAVRALLKNAQDATPPGAGIRITADETPDQLRLSVSDEGTGMSPEVLAHAGEPFFTTKPPGRGMGLGLFLARTVVEELGGSLSISSSPGEGTRVALTLRTTSAAAGGGSA